MVLFAFGLHADSWFIGNSVWNAYQNLPKAIADSIQNETLALENIQWGSIGPDGLCCLLLKTDEIYCSQIPNLVADLKPANLFGLSIQPVDHVTFSPGGGWFVRYTNGRVRLSMVGSFPAFFHRLAKSYLQTTAFSPQDSEVQYVFFGADDAILIQLTNGQITWEGLPDSLVTAIRAKAGEGWTLSKNTSLCQWNKDNYFIEWTRFYGMETSYSWRIQLSGILTDILIREVVEGQVPVSHTVYNPTPAPPTPLSSQAQAGGNRAVALYDYSAQDMNEIDLKEDEYITNLEFPDTDWWRGQNQQGKVGLFPSQYVNLVSDTSGLSGKETAVPHQSEIQTPNATSPVYVNCDGCDFKVVTGSYYHCGTCNSDNFDLCPACFDAGAWCNPNHPVIHRSLQNDKISPSPGNYVEPSAIPSLYISCDGCEFKVVTGPYYHCGICNSDNFDLCPACFDAGAWCCEDHPVIQRSLQNENTNTIHSSDPLPDMSSLRLYPKPPPRPQTTSSSSLLPGATPAFHSPSPSHSPGSQPEKKDEYGQQLRDSLEGTVVSESPNVHWDDIAGLDQAKEELQETTILPIKFPQLFTGNRKPRRAILLYGPPGTGKSFLAKAVATEVECPLFSISSSDIASKWMGESERLVKTLFELARERKPSIIFIDEIEALCGSRESQDEHSARMLTEFLVQMDGVGRDSSGILVLAATNLPWKLDAAVRRRFQRRIHISLPDQKARTRMFEITVGDTPCDLRADDYARLGAMTEGFSGSDISTVVQEALMQPVKKIRTATHYRKVNHSGAEKLTPSDPHEPGAVAMSWRQVPPPSSPTLSLWPRHL